MNLCTFATLRLGTVAPLHLCTFATLQLCIFAFLQLSNLQHLQFTTCAICNMCNFSPSCLPHLLQSNLPFHSKPGNCLHLALHPSGIIINSLRISLYLLIEELKDLLYKSFKLYWKSQVFNLSFSSFQVLCLDINLDRKGLRGSFRIFKKKTNILRIFIAKL